MPLPSRRENHKAHETRKLFERSHDEGASGETESLLTHELLSARRELDLVPDAYQTV
jgi:hypothetical protein